MKMFANGVNGAFLLNVLPGANRDIEWVKAAIAYGDYERTLVNNCLEFRTRLDIWMRYDHTVPVSPVLLRYLLRCSFRNVFCRLVPDVLHSTVIWWRGYGVYIGSANLTDRAWVKNIEFGVFLSESELESAGVLMDIELFFDTLDPYEQVIDLSEKVIKEQESIQKASASGDEEAGKQALALGTIPEWEGPIFISDERVAVDRQKKAFIKEWKNGATILSGVSLRAPLHRPRWLNDDVPPAWQSDQFLHAYYHNQVVDGASHPYEDFYRASFKSPAATESALV